MKLSGISRTPSHKSTRRFAHRPGPFHLSVGLPLLRRPYSLIVMAWPRPWPKRSPCRASRRPKPSPSKRRCLFTLLGTLNGLRVAGQVCQFQGKHWGLSIYYPPASKNILPTMILIHFNHLLLTSLVGGVVNRGAICFSVA